MSLTAVSRGCVCVKANLHNRKLLIMRKRKMTAEGVGYLVYKIARTKLVRLMHFMIDVKVE